MHLFVCDQPARQMHDVIALAVDQSTNQSLFKAGNKVHKTNTGNTHIYK